MGEDLTCSKGGCGKQILGMGVLLADNEGLGIRWEEGGFRTYQRVNEEGELSEFVMLHPQCFLDLFDELMKQEVMVSLQFMVGGAGDYIDGLGMNERRES